MAFSKSFPKKVEGSNYTEWVEVELSAEEEKKASNDCKRHNFTMMLECIDDAKLIVRDKLLMESQMPLTEIAIALFEKRASHEVFFKEKLAKEKFDSLHLSPK